MICGKESIAEGDKKVRASGRSRLQGSGPPDRGKQLLDFFLADRKRYLNTSLDIRLAVVPSVDLLHA